MSKVSDENSDLNYISEFMKDVSSIFKLALIDMGYKILKSVKEYTYGNCNRGSNESDDESQRMHESVSVVPGK